MKKFIIYTALVISVVLCVIMTSCAGGKTTPAEDFSYEMADGEVMITGYRGTDLEIYIPSTINDRPVTKIADEAFEGYDMTFISIPDSVTVIGEFAFCDCSCLTTIDLPDSVTSIGRVAFGRCTSLEKITLPASLELIEDKTFLDCSSLKKIKFPEVPFRIEPSVFSGCAFEEIDFPKNTEYIEGTIFYDCNNLKTVKVPENTTIFVERYEDKPIVSTFVGVSSEEDPLNTEIIVSKNSYAYRQFEPYLEGYGLNVTVK